jgi:hypothetical protein
VQLPIGKQTFGKSFLGGRGRLEVASAEDAWGALFKSDAPFGPATTDVALLSVGAAEDARDLELGRAQGLRMTVAANGSVAGSLRLIRSKDDPLLSLPELKDALRKGQLYVALELNGSAAGSVKASYVTGPLTPTFGLAAGGNVGYTRLKLYRADASAREILGDLFKGLRLPASVEDPSEIPEPGELLVFRYGGYLDLTAGVQWGYCLSGLRSFEPGKLDLALAYSAEVGAHLDLRYRLAGDFEIEALAGHDDGWVRLVVRKSRSSRFDAAADIGVDADVELKGLPADPNAFLGALLGTSVESFVGLLDEAARCTDLTELREKVDSLAWGFLQKRADSWLGEALDGRNAARFFGAAREVVLAFRALDARIVRLVGDFCDDLPALRKGLSALASLTGREGFADLGGPSVWRIVDALFGDRLHDLLLDDGAFGAFQAAVARANALVAEGVEVRLLELIQSIEKDYRLDAIFDALAGVKSAQALRELADQKLRGIVERLVGRAFDDIVAGGAGDALKQVNGVLAKLEGFKKAWYERLRQSTRQAFTAHVAYAFTRASREAQLLDLEINLGREEGADLLRRAAGGSFARALLACDPGLVQVRQGVLTHQLEKSASLRVNVYGWEYSSLTRVVQDFEHAVETDASGLVHVYTVKTQIEQKKARGRRFKESVDSTFLLAAVGQALQPAGLAAPVDERTGAFLLENLRRLSVQYDLVLRDQQTTASELTDYLGLGERLQLVRDAAAVADQIARDFPTGLGDVRARYVVRYDDAGVRSAFTLPTADVERIARETVRHLAASELIGDGERPWTAAVGFAYQSPGLADLFYNKGYTAVLAQARTVKLPAWKAGGQPREEPLNGFQRQVLVALYSIEDSLTRRLAELDRLVDRCLAARVAIPLDELQTAARRFVEMGDDLDTFAGQNAFFGVFDAIVQAGSNGKGRRESALVLEITPPGSSDTVTRVLMGGEPTLPAPA